MSMQSKSLILAGELFMQRLASLFLVTTVISLPLAGCVKRERVVDVDTPIGGAKVDKVTTPDGETHVDVNVGVGNKKPVEPVVP
jgi:hypothetical protein